MNKLWLTILILAFITLNKTLKKDIIVGKVVAITDGDTFKLLTKDSTLIKVRLANIDCPEKKQPFSKKAKQFASSAIFSKTVILHVLKRIDIGVILVMSSMMIL